MAESVKSDGKGDDRIENLIAARKSLKLSLEKSKSLGLALKKAGPILDEMKQRLPSLEAAVRPIRAEKEALVAAGGHINRAIGPAAAVLKVFDAVHGLEKSLLSDPRNDLPGYLSVIKRLEEALRFLGGNCGLAIQWLEDIVEYLEDNVMADERHLSNLKKSLKGLRELQSDDERAHLDGGLLNAALDKLEGEFRRLLTEHSVPLPMSSSSTLAEQAVIAPSQLPKFAVRNVRASLRALDLDYLEISIAEFNDVQSIEGYIAQWGKHLEFAVKHLFEAEYKLCNDVFERLGLDVWMGCFSKIAAQAGILAFLQFGKTVTESKKDPIKLLKLLDIFASLNKLRLDFNRLFGGAACIEIQNLTRDLIRRVIDGAAEIFWELLVQVDLQRQIPPPPDGNVPILVSIITEYCNKLLGDNYKPILSQVLVIHRSWKHEKFQEKILVGEGTKVGDLLGDSWFREHDRCRDQYAEIFLRESWGKLPGHLSREGLILFSGGRATARDLVKKRLKTFNEAFDEMYKKQSSWVVPDRDLREKICQQIVQAVVPIYRSYMQNYGPLVELDGSSNKYARYSVQTLEQMLSSLFLPKPGRYASFKGRQLSDKFNNGVADLRRTTSAVV
ncbi:EXOCYST SUBUNIT EXO70 FAMILY PROTEIN [Salix purpurea]|uniref:Exocyst subunit Exo70 family protein n=1 Tax=Salix purpurea TaxID=77065 RepID=A0A9Q0Q0H9_SALPP|nr:EXOCYST SUBUNIT EXO70 FAMILY PROTEIN [Salix purpurea]